MNVPLLDLRPQLEALRPQLLEAVTNVLDSTRYILGPEVEQLERATAEYCGSGFGIGVSSGTDALIAALMALDLGPGDRVATTPYTFFATMGSVIRVGAEPVFVDVEPDSLNMDPERLAELLEEDRRGGRTIKAILPVHLYGQCANMQAIMRLAADYELPVIEDAAQAIGSECPMTVDGSTQWRRAGSIGLAGCFSFFPSKNLGGIGDGGLVVTSDRSFADLLISLRNHGAEPKYYHSRIGGNFRLDPIQAAVLKVKLPHLEDWHRGRQVNANLYRRLFTEAGLVGTVTLPSEIWADQPDAAQHQHHIYNQFVLRVPERDRLRDHLLQHSVGCEVYYPVCLHEQECLHKFDFPKGGFPVAEQAAKETLALPIYPELTPEHLDYVVEQIRTFYAA